MAQFLIGGDFNARLGHNDDSFAKEFQFSPPTIDGEQYFPSRFSLDTKVNFSGLCLWRVFNKLNLITLNGSAPGDQPGQFTYWTTSGASTIDYLAISPGLALRVNKFEIISRSESDHLPLTLYCNFDTDLLKPRSQLHLDTSVEPAKQRITWSFQLNNRIRTWLESQQARMIHSELSNPGNAFILETYGEFTQILTSLLSSTSSKHPPSKTYKKNGLM